MIGLCKEIVKFIRVFCYDMHQVFELDWEKSIKVVKYTLRHKEDIISYFIEIMEQVLIPAANEKVETLSFYKLNKLLNVLNISLIKIKEIDKTFNFYSAYPEMGCLKEVQILLEMILLHFKILNKNYKFSLSDRDIVQLHNSESQKYIFLLAHHLELIFELLISLSIKLKYYNHNMIYYDKHLNILDNHSNDHTRNFAKA